MFARSAVDVTALLAAENELAICCRALTPLLALARRPRARWRTRLVGEGGLRFFRTMLLGRAPGFAPGPAVVGPWRPVALERRRRLDSADCACDPASREGRRSRGCRAHAHAGRALPRADRRCDSMALRGSHTAELALRGCGARGSRLRASWPSRMRRAGGRTPTAIRTSTTSRCRSQGERGALRSTAAGLASANSGGRREPALERDGLRR